MTTIHAKTADQILIATVLPTISTNNVNSVRLHIDFDSSWDGYAKSAVFFTSKNPTVYEKILSSDGACLVPSEVLTESGRLFIGVKGINGGIEKHSTLLNIKISFGTPLVLVSDPTDSVYNQLLQTNAVMGARLDLIESGVTPEADEVVGVRVGANGKTYANAGTAVREQFAEKLDAIEKVPVDYEIGNIDINVAGWNYDSSYYQSTRVRVKEGSEIRLVAGDVIGLTDYSNARYYVGYRDLEGTYYYAGWLTEDFICTIEADYIILVSNTVDTAQTNVNDLGYLISVRKVDGAANQARNASALVSAAVDIDLGFVLGSANVNGFLNYESRYVTRNILCLDIDITLKRVPDKYRMAVHTYTDASGAGYEDLGWVTDKADYIIPAGTYFRILAMAKDYESERTLVIDPAKQYETELYKSLEIYPVVGKKINLLKTARTLARIAASGSQRASAKRPVAPPQMRSINHRGYNYIAPENTLPAFKLSKKNGFDFVECDVRWTSDNMPVILHDVSINRTARNANGTKISETINIADIDYATALTYDFGGDWTGYKGTKIPTFEEYIALCRNIQLHPYIEIEEEIFEWQAVILMDIVKKYGMEDHVTWISFTHNSLLRIIEQNPRSRVGYNRMATHLDIEKELHMVGLLKTDFNEAFLNIAYNNTSLTEYTEAALNLDIPVEVWCPSTADEILALPAYVSGVTTDKLIAHSVLYKAFVN